ncbi:hypothetical protein, partial [Streptomyces galilaeus]|uniref:hypothetical protein n=1 Tax=Streptomyces galilaeus TaxID=33899 RepID=UPI0038F77BD4
MPKPSGSRMNYNLQDQVISACNVPDFIGSNDKIIDVYHDRIPYQFFHDMCEKHFKSGPLGISRLQGKKMLAFVQDLFNGECDWCGKYEGINGARITEFTNVSNGYPVF